MQNKWSLLPQRQVLLDTALLGICSLLLLLQKSRLKGEAFAVLNAGFTTTVSWLSSWLPWNRLSEEFPAHSWLITHN